MSLYPSENDATSVLQPPNLFYSLVGRDGKQLGDPGELNYGELGRLVRAEDVLAVEFRLLLQYLVLSSVYVLGWYYLLDCQIDHDDDVF